ncbi:MAG: YfiR family protein [Calditrichaceae bacterium]|nr:YfiR family protein [Calditrichaceae bacterium]
MKLIFICLVIMTFNLMVCAEDHSEVSQNDLVKSVFIYNFTKYIHWPSDDTSDVFNIGIFGENDINIPLREIARKKTVSGRKIQIKQYNSPEDIDHCHILFVPSGVKEMIPDILGEVKNKSILTVSDADNFSEQGGMITFILIEGKIKFEINIASLEQAKLTAGSELLKLAILVDENK